MRLPNGIYGFMMCDCSICALLAKYGTSGYADGVRAESDEPKRMSWNIQHARSLSLWQGAVVVVVWIAFT